MENRTFKVLEEKAVHNDLFEDKTHEKVAETLNQVIRNASEKGLTIGIEGGWGTGKSSVISILKEKLDKQKDIRYFYFDAWAHEGDPLRRVFLESLIEQIGDGDNQLTAIQQKITNHEKTTNIETKQQVTELGKFLALAALFVPFGSVWFTAITKQNTITFNLSLPISWTITISLFFSSLFTIAPLIVLFGNLIRLVCRKYYCKNDLKIGETKHWMFLQSEINQISKQEISEDNERSSIEFEQYFDKIMHVIFSKKQIKKIVIVIDNLDRVSPNDTLTIWSTLQTFLQERNPVCKVRPHYEKLWVIVPYDPNGMKKVWDRESEDNKCSKSFFEKCFQLRIEVPRFIISGWETFTIECIEQALVDFTMDEKRRTLNVLKITRTAVNDAPSPREVKIFVNQVGLLRLHSPIEISVEAIALFVVLKYLVFMTNEEIEDKLLFGRIPDEKYASFFNDSLKKELCGLLCGVLPEKGVQLLLEPKIEHKMLEYDCSGIKEIEKLHGGAFWTVFDLHMQKIKSTDTLLKYSRTIHSVFSSQDNNKLSIFIKSLEMNFKTIDKIYFPKDEVDTNEWVSVLTLLKEKSVLVNELWKEMLQAVSVVLKNSEFDENRVCKNLGMLSIHINTEKEEPFEISNVPLVSWMKWASIEKSETRFIIRPSMEITTEITNAIRSGECIPIGFCSLLKFLRKQGLSNFSEIGDALFKNLTTKQAIPTNSNKCNEENFKFLIDLLFYNENKLFSLFGKPEFYNLAYELNLVEYVALAIGIIYSNDFSAIYITPVSHSQTCLQKAKDFWKDSNQVNAKFVWGYAKEHHEYRFFWNIANISENKLFKDVLMIGLTEQNKTFFSCNDGVSTLRKCLVHFDYNSDEIQQITEIIGKCGKIENQISNNLNIIEASTELSLILKYAHTDKIRAIIKKNILTVNNVEWMNALEEGTRLLDIAIELKRLNSDFNLVNDYAEALSDFLKNWLINKGNITDWQKKNLANLICLLTSDFREHCAKKLGRTLAEMNFVCNNEAYCELHQNIDFRGLLKNNFEKFEIGVDTFIENLDIEQLKRLADIIDANMDSKYNPPSHYSTVLNKPLLAIIDKNTDATIIAKKIANFFNVNIVEDTEDELSISK